MRISAKGRYGLRALFDLALNYGQGPILIKDIARRQIIPEAYLEQIFLSLKKAGLVKSLRGAYGGYLLAREPQGINIKEIMDILEGADPVVPCLENAQVCSLFKDCLLKDFWEELGQAQNSLMGRITLADLVRKKTLRRQELAPPVYNI